MNIKLPEMITKLPEIKMPIDSVKGYLIQGEDNQSVFQIETTGIIPFDLLE